MSERSHPEREVAEVVRLLTPLAGTKATFPPSDTIYWRAQAWLSLDEASRRRRTVLRPLRLFHLAIGVGAIAVAVLVSVWPLFLRSAPGTELFAVPFLIVMVTVGAYWLAEAGRACP